jgi:Uma2 family endonuclease
MPTTVESAPPLRSDVAARARYLERPTPLVFPESQEVPESQLHLDLRTLLYWLLQQHLGETHTVGSDQFVYWDASNPARCLAPDVYVKCTPARERVRSWKIWERGAPDVAVEIISDSDSLPADWNAKLAQYQTLGVSELVRVDLLTGGPRLRVWNRVDGVLSERVVDNEMAPSLVLPLNWTLAPVLHLPTPYALPIAVRITDADDPSRLVPTPHERAATEAARAATEAQRAVAEAAARQVAEARVAELETLLKKRDSGV